ncbi:MAG: hypothetical protein ACRD6N_02840 [Pyrinomonadaceae bacterium]
MSLAYTMTVDHPRTTTDDENINRNLHSSNQLPHVERERLAKGSG